MAVYQKTELVCPKCNWVYPESYDGLTCPCGGVLKEKKTIVVVQERKPKK